MLELSRLLLEPGDLCSTSGLPFYYNLFWFKPFDVILITLIVVFLSVWICEKATARLRDEDKDEVLLLLMNFRVCG